MRLKIKDLKFSSGGPLVVIINNEDALKLNVRALDRVRIKNDHKEIVVVLDVSEKRGNIKTGEIGLFKEVFEYFKVKDGDLVSIHEEQKPISLTFIKNKLDGIDFSKSEIDIIIKDIVENELTEIEITYFVSACYTRGLSLLESSYLTEAIVKHGGRLKFNKKPILDKHCLTPENSILIKEGNIIKRTTIGELVDKSIKKVSSPEYKDLKNNIEIASFDKDFKVSFKRIKKIFKLPSPDIIYELTLRGNKKIKLTGDHEVYLLKNSRLIKKPISECNLGENVIIPKKIELPENNNIEIRELLNKSKRCKNFNLNLEPSPELARLLGYYVAEGFTNYQGLFLNFGSHEKGLIEDSARCIKKVFGIKPTIGKAHKTAVRVRIYSRNIKRIFDGWKIGDNAQNKRIPPFVFGFNKELKKEFLKGYILGDGHTRRSYEIQIITISRDLVLDLQYLLASLGVSCALSEVKECFRTFPNGQTCKIQKAYSLYIQAIELFNLKRKYNNNAFTNLIPISEIESSINLNLIHGEMGRMFKRQKYLTSEKLIELEEYFINSNLKNYLEGNLSTLPIKEIKILNKTSDYVYDLEVEDNHTFFSGDFPIGISNCTGGIPGNRTTMIIVPIIAAAGFTIPKTSTKSITSPAGTADTMEVLAEISHSKEKIQEIVKKTNGCIVWGGTLDLASADDKLIKIEKALSLDPEGILLASVLAKKSAANSTHVLIDIPVGPNTKIKTKEKAEELSHKFIELGKKLNLKIKTMISDGSQPIGNGIGPALEARDILLVLQNKGPKDLKNKAVYMASLMLEMVGVKNPYAKALHILESGLAYKKMKEIIKAQGGNPEIKPEEINLGKFRYEIKEKKSGIITHINNELISRIAKIAGAPINKGAGINCYLRVGDKVKKEDTLFTIYAEDEKKLNYAINLNKGEKVIEII